VHEAIAFVKFGILFKSTYADAYIQVFDWRHFDQYYPAKYKTG
jgi:hypothetical protein